MCWKINKLKRGQQVREWCVTHGKKCCVGVDACPKGQVSIKVEAAGPTCCPFSFAGKRQQVLKGGELH